MTFHIQYSHNQHFRKFQLQRSVKAWVLLLSCIFTLNTLRLLANVTTSANNETPYKETTKFNKTSSSFPTHTLVVVRCRGKMDWLKDVPNPGKEWRVVVYENCASEPSEMSTNYSIISAVQAENEECNGYLDYLYNNYWNLTEVTVFFHDDGLISHAKEWRKKAVAEGKDFYHTPFHNFSQVVSTTNLLLTPERPFVSFGTKEIWESFGNNAYHGESQKILWPFLRTDAMPNPPHQLNYLPGGHFAVHREAIHCRIKEIYWTLMQQVRYSRDAPEWKDSRKMCCAMERMWHMLFCQPPTNPMPLWIAKNKKKEKY